MDRKGYARRARPRRKIKDFLFGQTYQINDISPVNIPGIYDFFNKNFSLIFFVELQELYFTFSGNSDYYQDYKTKNFKKENGDIKIFLRNYNIVYKIWLVISPNDDVIIETVQ